MSPLIPPGAEARFIDTPSGLLRVLHGGAPREDRVPVVLVHGGGSDNAAISWYRLFEPLGAEREVWAVDLPGFGGSANVPPVGGPDALAKVVVEAMDALELKRVVVGGVSMGGDVAMNVALSVPDRVRGLVLIAPGGLISVFRNPRMHRWAWRTAQLSDRWMLPLTRFANRFVRTALRRMVKDPSTLPEVVVEAFVREARQPNGSVAYLRYNQATIGKESMRNDLRGRLQEITAPTLLLHGEDDPLVHPADSRLAAERIPEARLVLLPDCGHWVQLEAHDRVLPELVAFLAAVDRSAVAST